MEPGEAVHRSRMESGHAAGPRVRAVPRRRRGTGGPGFTFEPRKGSPMGSSAFEIVFIPVLRGTVYGIVMGMAMLALMRALPLPRGTDTRGSNLEQGRKIVSDPLPERDGTG